MPSARRLTIRSIGTLAAILVLAGVVLLLLARPAPPPQVEAVRAHPPAVPPPPAVFLGRRTFVLEEQVRVTDAIDRLLRHPSDFCVELARQAWHRWHADRISNGRDTSLCPPFRFGYMGGATGETYLCERAFESDAELAATLVHEERHHLRPDENHRRARDWDAMCRVGD